MASHHDYGIDNEAFCGGAPDDEPNDCRRCGILLDAIEVALEVLQQGYPDLIGDPDTVIHDVASELRRALARNSER